MWGSFSEKVRGFCDSRTPLKSLLVGPREVRRVVRTCNQVSNSEENVLSYLTKVRPLVG